MGRKSQPMSQKTSLIWRLSFAVLIIAIPGGLAIYSLFPDRQSLLTSKIFDWPFLAFILLICLVVLFYDSLSSALSRGELTIAWSKDQSIKVSNLAAAISGELDPIREDIDALKAEIEELRSGSHRGYGAGRGGRFSEGFVQQLAVGSES